MKINEESMIEDMAREIQEQIDWEIMCDMLKILGWHAVRLEPSSTVSQAEITQWLVENSTGNYRSRNNTWMFRDNKDAMLFSLRWL